MSQPAGAPVEVVIAVEPAQPFEAVVARLGAAGLAVTQALPAIGTVVGHAPESALERLEAVDGVLAVERSVGYRLPPPDSPVQ